MSASCLLPHHRTNDQEESRYEKLCILLASFKGFAQVCDGLDSSHRREGKDVRSSIPVTRQLQPVHLLPSRFHGWRPRIPLLRNCCLSKWAPANPQRCPCHRHPAKSTMHIDFLKEGTGRILLPRLRLANLNAIDCFYTALLWMLDQRGLIEGPRTTKASNFSKEMATAKAAIERSYLRSPCTCHCFDLHSFITLSQHMRYSEDPICSELGIS